MQNIARLLLLEILVVKIQLCCWRYISCSPASCLMPHFSVKYHGECLCHGCRNFGESDYEALLELDNEPAVARPRLSERELGRLQTHIHRLKTEALPKRLPRLVPGSTSSCADKVAQLEMAPWL